METVRKPKGAQRLQAHVFLQKDTVLFGRAGFDLWQTCTFAKKRTTQRLYMGMRLLRASGAAVGVCAIAKGMTA